MNGTTSALSRQADSSVGPRTQPQHWRRLLYPASGGLALILLALVSWWQRPAAAPARGILRTAQITTTAGLDIYPAFSPDGGTLAYTSLRNGRFELFLPQLASGGRE